MRTPVVAVLHRQTRIRFCTQSRDGVLRVRRRWDDKRKWGHGFWCCVGTAPRGEALLLRMDIVRRLQGRSHLRDWHVNAPRSYGPWTVNVSLASHSSNSATYCHVCHRRSRRDREIRSEHACGQRPSLGHRETHPREPSLCLDCQRVIRGPFESEGVRTPQSHRTHAFKSWANQD